MKKLMFSIMLLILFPLTIQADKVDYSINLITKCEKTKNRKVCLRAIKAELALTVKHPGAPHAITSKKRAYHTISMMLSSPCRKGSSWKKEACKLERYYGKKWHDEVFKYHSKESRENWGT